MSNFFTQVHKVVQAIPRGQTLSYGEVARRAGYPGAARAVGTLMKHNDNPKTPCHRVIKADGSLGRYNGLKGQKRSLLLAEGALKKGETRVLAKNKAKG